MNTEYVNLEYLYELSGGDEDFIRDMLESFIEQTPQIINDLQKLYADKNWDDLCRLAHKTKSSMSFIGVQQMSEDLTRVEKLCSVPVGEREIGEIMASLQRSFDLTKAILIQKLDELNK